jgi:hypothetical protein
VSRVKSLAPVRFLYFAPERGSKPDRAYRVLSRTSPWFAIRLMIFRTETKLTIRRKSLLRGFILGGENGTQDKLAD